MGPAQAKDLAEIRARWIKVRDALTQFLQLAPDARKIAEEEDAWRGLVKSITQIEKTAGVIDKQIARLTQEDKTTKPSGETRRRKPSAASRRGVGHVVRAQRVKL